MNSFKIFCVALLCCNNLISGSIIDTKNEPVFHTVVTTKNITGEYDKNTYHKGAYIDVHVIKRQHNLYIGRCLKEHRELHRENIILNNDGKSHVSADIKINVDAPVNITCVNVLDQLPSSGAYPYFLGGGVGYNYVNIGVTTEYGKGFHFFIQIFGYTYTKRNKQT